ncbi:phosphotransferase [Leptolyngbya ohadii]|uniref:phosphotransferase n=1 Tax=Leptolyngbya ohadii TaxID=1962290 RepID=UPI000B59B3E0|nr:phosphotransferase [Leptolyngbya ohadii]
MSTQLLDLRVLKQQLAAHLQANSEAYLSQSHNPPELELLAHGEANVIFRLGQTALVRVAVNTPNQRFGGDIRRVTQFEQTILSYLEQTVIGHRLLAASLEPIADFPYTFLITNYLEGTSLDYSRNHLQKCAHTLAKLHRLPTIAGYETDRLCPAVPVIEQPLTLFYQEAKDYAQPYLDSPDADPDIVEMLRAVLDRARSRLRTEALLETYPHRCLVHSDHTFENWVINDCQAYLIDWEWAEIGSPAGDLGHFLSPVTVRRRQNYRLPPADRAFFLQCYYDALEDGDLAQRIERHFAAFGVFPAVRSLCWTAGYWITANRWYAESEDSPSAAERMARLQRSRQQFPELWQEVMGWLDEEI